MKKFQSWTFHSLVLAFSASCAPISPTIRLTPTVPAFTTRFENRPPLALTVRGLRTDKTIGTLASRSGGAPTPIALAVPLQEIMEQQVMAGLTAIGFQVSATPAEEMPSLVIHIENFHYEKNPPRTDADFTVYGTIVATGKNGLKTLTKTYAIENGKKFPLGLSNKGIQKLLSDALTDCLKALLTDETFLQFLAQ